MLSLYCPELRKKNFNEKVRKRKERRRVMGFFTKLAYLELTKENDQVGHQDSRQVAFPFGNQYGGGRGAVGKNGWREKLLRERKREIQMI